MTYFIKFKRVLWTAVIVLLLCVVFIPSARESVFEGHFFADTDNKAQKYVKDGFERAGTAFAIARSFNAIVSVFQESELQLEPGGVGVSLALGAALDPANDLVERFSWVMLASLTSLGIQKVLIEITPFVSVRIFLAFGLCFLLAGLWLPFELRHRLFQIGGVLVFAAILLRFAVPSMAYLNHQVYVKFLEKKHNDSVRVLDDTVKELESQKLNDMTEEYLEENDENTEIEEEGMLDRILGGFGTTIVNAVNHGKNMLDVKTKFETVKEKARKIIDTIVDLIVVFVLSAIVLPLLFLWGFLKVGKLLIKQGGSPWLGIKSDQQSG